MYYAPNTVLMPKAASNFGRDFWALSLEINLVSIIVSLWLTRFAIASVVSGRWSWQWRLGTNSLNPGSSKSDDTGNVIPELNDHLPGRQFFV